MKHRKNSGPDKSYAQLNRNLDQFGQNMNTLGLHILKASRALNESFRRINFPIVDLPAIKRKITKF
jgi:hypothetical protein